MIRFTAFRLVKRISVAALLLLGLTLPPAAGARSSLAPVLSRPVVVSVVSGRVSVEPRGAHSFSRLLATRAIPVGSTVDTAHGTVKLVTADTTRGKTQFGVFDHGVFVVTQDRSGLTTLRLVGGRSPSKVCAARRTIAVVDWRAGGACGMAARQITVRRTHVEPARLGCIKQL